MTYSKNVLHIIRNTFGGVVQRFVTKPCRKIGICRVFCYEGGGGGGENPENRVTYYVDVPLNKYGFFYCVRSCERIKENADSRL